MRTSNDLKEPGNGMFLFNDISGSQKKPPSYTTLVLGSKEIWEGFLENMALKDD